MNDKILQSDFNRLNQPQKEKQDRGANLACTEQYAKIANCMRQCMESKLNNKGNNGGCGDFKC